MEEKTLSEWRFGHSDQGQCFVAFAKDGSALVTGGADGELRVHQGEDYGDGESATVGDRVLALCCAGERAFTSAPMTNRVVAYDLSGEEPEQDRGFGLRTAADPTTLDVSSDGTMLAAGAEDMIVRVVDSEEGKEVSFSGHGGPVLCVALDPAEDKQFVASTACDGTARVWNLQSEGQLCQLDIELPKTPDVSTSNTRCPVAWAPPNGRNLAVASHTKVKIFERDTWKTALEIKPLLEKEELISALTWSSDGQRLAVATTCGRLFLYRQDATALAVWKTDRGYAIVGLSWHPAQDTLALVDNRGYWKVLDSLGGKGTSVNNTSGTAEGKSASKNDDVMNEDELAAALFDDSDDENSFSIRQIKKDTGFLSDEDSNSMKEAPNKSALDAKDGEGLMPPPAAPQPSVVPQPTIVTTGPPEVEPQQPFQPSSTPSHLSSFFMVWNAVGVVKCLNDEDEPSVEVEFHDSAVHHPMHLGNAAGHTMADLSSTCLALACEAIEDELKPSRLVVHHFSVADAAREWTLEMPEGEEIMAIACSREWVAVATDRRRLRLYTASGMQRDVLSLPGPVVALAGHGDRLVIVVHSAPPSLGSQYMAYALLDVPRRMLLGQRYQPLPLTPRATLSWLGFSDEGSPCSADGAGVVRLLDLRRRVWREVCDTHVAVKSRSDNHFVLGVSEAEWNIRTILCKGSRYPLTLPRPTPGLLRMSLPLCEPATERASMEANLLTDELSGAGDEASLLMKLFALACRGEADSRALDVARLMDAATVQVAMKYAAKSRRPALASRLSELACQAQERETATADSVDIFDGASSIGGGADRRLDEVDEDEEEAAENPLLAAKAKRENAKPRPIGIAQNPSRNPFKKSSAQSSGSIRPGIVFDDMTTQVKNRSVDEIGFGNRTVKLKTRKSVDKGKQTTLFSKSPAVTGGKENSSTNEGGSGTPLKGFQLWLAEHKEELSAAGPIEDSELAAKGLELWKKLSKDEKDSYKTPRAPKRKRVVDDDDAQNDRSAKLAAFTAD